MNLYEVTDAGGRVHEVVGIDLEDAIERFERGGKTATSCIPLSRRPEARSVYDSPPTSPGPVIASPPAPEPKSWGRHEVRVIRAAIIQAMLFWTALCGLVGLLAAAVSTEWRDGGAQAIVTLIVLAIIVVMLVMGSQSPK